MIIELNYPELDHKEKVANIAIKKNDITEETVTIQNAFSDKNKYVMIIIENNGKNVGQVMFKNLVSVFGVNLGFGVSVINLKDVKMRGIGEDLILEFNKDFEGIIYAIGEWNYDRA